jgi:hypothetical protein
MELGHHPFELQMQQLVKAYGIHVNLTRRRRRKGNTNDSMRKY